MTSARHIVHTYAVFAACCTIGLAGAGLAALWGWIAGGGG